MWLTTILIGILVALVSKYVIDRKKRLRFFADQGISGPNPHFIFGTLREHQGSNSKLMEWRKKYGKTFCIYEGDRPTLVTSDLDILKQVYIKDFSNFHSREFSIFFTPDDSMFLVKGKVWKRLRMIVGPTFRAKKMKEMSPLLNICVDSLLEVLDGREKEDKPFDIMKDFQGLTMTVIASCAFGLEINALKDPNDIFLQKCKSMQNLSVVRPFYKLLAMGAGFLFPSLAPAIRKVLPNQFKEKRVWFDDAAAAIVEARRNIPTKRNDFIQLLMNAEQQGHPDDMSKLEVSLSDDNSESIDKPSEKPLSTTSMGKGMNMREIQGTCRTFLIAGYETTSSALSFTAYELALHPDIQEKLQLEIDEHFPGDAELPDYLSVQKMPYMDMVFSEVLRLHSIAKFATVRRCVEDWNLNGLNVPKGALVLPHMEAVHMDPDHWGPEDPQEFIPDRFLPERKAARNPLAWQPFGGGPRNCVGIRFALMEAKITLARLLKTYTIRKTDQTVVPIKTTDAGIARPKEGVMIKLERRS